MDNGYETDYTISIQKLYKENKMKKKILITGLLVSVLSVAGYAYENNNQSGTMMMKQGNMGSNQTMKQQRCIDSKRGMMPRYAKMMKRKSMMNGMMSRHFKIMHMFRQLNLDSNQRYKISIARDEMKLDMKKLMGPNRRKEMLNFITDSGFDKAAFKKHMNEMHTKMLDIRANGMEKIFNILTKEQIAQLKKNIAN